MNVIMICAYIPPIGSIYYSDEDENGMELLRSKINEKSAQYPEDKIFVMGDLNSRIGQKQDFINDSVNDIPNMVWYIADDFNMQRKSKD